MSTLAITYATDEDIALRAAADYLILCPRDQKLASGTDGAFAPADRWTLTSDSVDFASHGLRTGQVVHLSKPIALFKPPGEMFAIESVSTGSMTLRRKGQAVGVGQPPGPPVGTVGVEFTVMTLGPQIDTASFGLDQRYGIGRLFANPADPSMGGQSAVKDATVLTVLYRQYLSMSREAGEHRDNFAAKAQSLKLELNDLLDRGVLPWNLAEAARMVQITPPRFSTRLSR